MNYHKIYRSIEQHLVVCPLFACDKFCSLFSSGSLAKGEEEQQVQAEGKEKGK